MIEIDQPTADLESTNGRMVFVLDPHLRAQALAKKRPAILGRGGHGGTNDTHRRFNVFKSRRRGRAHPRHLVSDVIEIIVHLLVPKSFTPKFGSFLFYE
jgi:hypothetical protein